MSKRVRKKERLPKQIDEYSIKFAAAKASSCVVTIVSRNIPVETTVDFSEHKRMMNPPKEIDFRSCGIVIECQSLPTANYLCTILAPASLFRRTADVCIADIQTDVVVPAGVLHKGRLLACDFHYNLAAVTIVSETPLQTANLKCIDDTLSIYPTHLLKPPTFQLTPHSDLFKIVPGTQLLTVWRSFSDARCLFSASGTFCSKRPKWGFLGAPGLTTLTCNELYEIDSDDYAGRDGGPVINSLGEIIGIIFNTSSFLPSNIISRWWNHYKSSGEFCRPIIGMEVANLYDSDQKSPQFVKKFPGISSGVFVTKVNEDSPASRSGICTNDIIVKLDGKPVQSKLKFYELIWEKAGKSVELNVLRVTNGEELNLSLVIEEASPDKFHQWTHPSWRMPY